MTTISSETARRGETAFTAASHTRRRESPAEFFGRKIGQSRLVLSWPMADKEKSALEADYNELQRMLQLVADPSIPRGTRYDLIGQGLALIDSMFFRAREARSEFLGKQTMEAAIEAYEKLELLPEGAQLELLHLLALMGREDLLAEAIWLPQQKLEGLASRPDIPERERLKTARRLAIFARNLAAAHAAAHGAGRVADPSRAKREAARRSRQLERSIAGPAKGSGGAAGGRRHP